MKIMHLNIYFRIILFFAFILAVSCTKEEVAEVQKQSFVKMFGNSQTAEGIKVSQTSDGNYLFLGNAFTGTGSSIILVKTDAYGNEIWFKTFGKDGENLASDMEKLTDGGYLILGSMHGKTDTLNKAWLLRTNAQGDIIWEKTIENTKSIYPFCLFTDGDKFLIGGSIQTTATNTDPVTLITDNNGQLLKTRVFELKTGNQKIVDINKKDSVYIELISNSLNASSEDFFLAVFDGISHHTVGEKFGRTGISVPKSLTKLNDGNFLLLSAMVNENNKDLCLINFNYSIEDDNIATNWQKYFGTPDNDDASEIVTTALGYTLCGTTTKTDESTDMLYLFLDAAFNETGKKNITASGNQSARALCPTSDNGTVLLGSNEYLGSGVALMIKLK